MMVAAADPHRIILKPRALADIEEIRSYIAQHSQKNADTMANLILDSVESLSVFPTRYKVHERRSNPALIVHSMPVNPYLIYYRVDQVQRYVYILTVRHGARRQPRRFR